jgi:hypothetical protein
MRKQPQDQIRRRMKTYTFYLQLDEDNPNALAKRPRIDPELWDLYHRRQKHFVPVARFQAATLQEAWAIIEPREDEEPNAWLARPEITLLASGIEINRKPLPGDVLEQDDIGFMRRSVLANNSFWYLYYDDQKPQTIHDFYQLDHS